MKFKAQVIVMLKPDLLDPQGKAVQKSMKDLGLEGIEDTRVGKVIRFFIEKDTRESAIKEVKSIAKTLLSNPVIEDTEIEIKEVSG